MQMGVTVRLSDGTWVYMPLVETNDPERFGFIEGSAFDLTLGRVYRAAYDENVPFIGRHKRVIPDVVQKKVCWRQGEPGDPVDAVYASVPGEWYWTLERGEGYLLESAETVNVPANLCCKVKARSSIFRSFATMTCSDAHPNYQGKLVVLVVPHHPNGLVIEMGARFAYVRFEEFDGAETDCYAGIWSGSKITTGGKEERAY